MFYLITALKERVSTKQMSSIEPIIKEWQYFLRATLAADICLKPALLQFLHNDLGFENYDGLPRDGKKLYDLLLRFKMGLGKELKCLNQQQWDIICPANGISDSEQFDVTIISVLIRNLLCESYRLPQPTLGWKNGDSKANNPCSMNDADYSVKARNLRNDIKHVSIDKIRSSAQFKELWTKIEKTLNGLRYKKNVYILSVGKMFVGWTYRRLCSDIRRKNSSS